MMWEKVSEIGPSEKELRDWNTVKIGGTKWQPTSSSREMAGRLPKEPVTIGFPEGNVQLQI